jgi:hypothetical protein
MEFLRMSKAERQRSKLARFCQRYDDFCPTFASEHLADEGMQIAPETLRRWSLATGLLTKRGHFKRPQTGDILKELR